MPLPDRPVTLTTIDSEWGQAVHDWTFAPKGGDFTTAVTDQVVSNTLSHLNLDVATDDPGGWLVAANDELEVPTGADGLYLAVLNLNTVNGDADEEMRGFIFLNGSSYSSTTVASAGGTNIGFSVVALMPLSAGDILQAWAQKRGTGTSPTVKVISFRLVRVGNEYGA